MNNHIPANPLTMAPAGRAAVAHRFPQLNMWLPRGNLGGRSCEQALEVGDVVAGEVLPFLDQIIDSCGEHPLLVLITAYSLLIRLYPNGALLADYNPCKFVRCQRLWESKLGVGAEG